MNDQIAMT
jgi:hypothetical protein